MQCEQHKFDQGMLITACMCSRAAHDVLNRWKAQVPLLSVLEEVQPVRVPGRQPLFQSWFDIQPASYEGDVTFEGLVEISNKDEVRNPMR